MSIEGRRRMRVLAFEKVFLSDRFCGARALQLLMVNFYIKIKEPLRSYFVGNYQKN